MTNISDCVRKHAQITPDKIYLIYGNISYTYKQSDDIINVLCEYLDSFLKLKSGSIVSAVLPNSVEYIFLYLAVIRHGSIINPFPMSLASQDLNKYLDIIHPNAMFCTDVHYDGLGKNNNKLLIDNNFLEQIVRSGNHYFASETNTACIYYSSGTTDNPKGIVHSNTSVLDMVKSVIDEFHFNSDDVHLIMLPLGHTSAINYSFLPCTMCGGTIVLAESFWKMRNSFWVTIKQFNITYVQTVPSILTALMFTPYSGFNELNILSLKWIGCSSSVLSKELQIKFQEKYGIPVGNLYGLSETGASFIDYPLVPGWKAGNIGIPMKINKAKIADDGEILISGNNLFVDYYRNRKLYDSVFDGEWFHTGDLGHIEDGVFYFDGRKKDLIIKGGVNIHPDEIDETLTKMAGIKESLTIGTPDEYLGEIITSYIVAETDIDIKDVEKHCITYLSRHKIPDNIIFVTSLPRGPTGKLLRRKLK